MASTADNYRARLGAWVKARLMRNPQAVKVDCEGLDLFVIRGVLPPELCEQLIELVDQYAVPSEVMAPHPDPDFRTSYSGNVPAWHPLIRVADDRIHQVIGIPREVGEPIQGQRYAVGQQFKPHWDYFLPNEPYYPEAHKQGGQRTWTAMAFLNEPEEGGHTQFPEVGVSIRPRAGNLLIWNNLTPDGELNPLSLHQGSPVTAGVKYIITKWHRESRFRHLPVD
jgi:prolyl 4-hydroxylase